VLVGFRVWSWILLCHYIPHKAVMFAGTCAGVGDIWWLLEVLHQEWLMEETWALYNSGEGAWAQGHWGRPHCEGLLWFHIQCGFVWIRWDSICHYLKFIRYQVRLCMPLPKIHQISSKTLYATTWNSSDIRRGSVCHDLKFIRYQAWLCTPLLKTHQIIG
jgi:hypothetical protein